MKEWRVCPHKKFANDWSESYLYVIFEGTRIVAESDYKDIAEEIVRDHNEKVMMANILNILKS